MRIAEEIFSKNIRLDTKDPFSLSLRIKEIASNFGEPVEKKNIYETDGPRKRVELSFELKKNIDKFTSSLIIFDLNGESTSNGFLDIRFKGILQTKMNKAGPVTRAFSDFYISDILPSLKKEFVGLKAAGKELEKRIGGLKNI
jgi:hypothetical protein